MKIIAAINYVVGFFLNAKKTRITYSLNYLNRARNIDRNYLDYIRLATLELVADELNSAKIEGSVAELGVYKGKFARYINQYFSQRTLYLFDTFEGFNKADIDQEKKQHFSTGEQDFSNTSINEVLKRMPFVDKCIVKQGYFPQTAKDVIDKFAFVSIDTDLYDPIYTGLNFFYPLLAKGGYIFVHDYNNDNYKGAKEAVNKFCLENNITKIVLPDSCGTAIITK